MPQEVKKRLERQFSESPAAAAEDSARKPPTLAEYATAFFGHKAPPGRQKGF